MMPSAGPDDTFQSRLQETADMVTVALDSLIQPAHGPEIDLMRAMRHAALANGKRMRPFYVMETGAMFEAPRQSLLRAACAIECVHTYSLIHDDLPCMDDDDYRRGQPTVHKAFGEATAVLAGDALLTLAFEILADPDTSANTDLRLGLITRLAKASGAAGMVGGQHIDMLETDSPRDLATITRMQRLKTGALISFSVAAGGMIGGASEKEMQSLNGFAHDLGLAYQISDDLLDVDGDPGILGKRMGKDAEAGKANFVTLLGVDDARKRVRLLATQAKEHLAIFHNRANILLQSVDYVLDRNH